MEEQNYKQLPKQTIEKTQEVNWKVISILLIVGIVIAGGWYLMETKFLPNIIDVAHAQGEIALVTDQVQNGVVYWVNETGGAIRVPVGQFCQEVLNPGATQ